jgi:hypothetical protein
MPTTGNPPADLGDVLLDEFDVIELRRKVLARATPAEHEETSVAPAAQVRTEPLEQKLQFFCDRVHQLGNVSALCLSGGGIRSAAFALGVAQGLAERNLLSRFDYLSTVSGGGYIGSFITAWAQRSGYKAVASELGGATQPVFHFSPLQHLRRYCSYLSPRLGVLSSDTLTLVALYVRNLVLNWLVLIPMLVVGLGAVKLIVELAWVWPPSIRSIAFCGAFAVAVIGAAVLDSLQQRPGWGDEASGRRRFLIFEMFPALLGGSFAGLAALKYFQNPTTPKAVSIVATSLDPIVGMALIGGVIFLTAAIFALAFCPPRSTDVRSTVDTIRGVPVLYAVLMIAIFSATGSLSGFTLATLQKHISSYGVANASWVAFGLMSLGPPLLVTAFFIGELLYCGLAGGLSKQVLWAEAEREWLARAAGYHARAALTWAVTVLLTFGGSALVFWLAELPKGNYRITALATTGGLAGLVTTLVGKATSTAATLKQSYSSIKGLSAGIVLAIATPIFIIVAVSLTSAGIDWVVKGNWLWFETNPVGRPIAPISALVWLTGIALSVGLIASFIVNTNQFSLHGMYRNRIIRTFLGASNDRRSPNPFTDFDQKDNMLLKDLWPNKPTDNPKDDTPPQLVVINMALNIVATRELAWQERKALSFTATARWIGCGDLGESAIIGKTRARGFYRSASEYGGPMTLGTAVTISGAAASPNMGYHSSPALSLLLTFFNVRLGAWLGNPNRSGNWTYKLLGPRFSARPMIQEAFGLTNEDTPYVYLSDGGHFDNLGLYEMVRRRCHLIVISDAGCDPTCNFEDLGNALRRISVDLKVDINFRSLKIERRESPPKIGPYCAIANIVYRDGKTTPGVLLYLKPGYHGDEPAPVRSYAAKRSNFPHESTADQWFRESQFEAYRALGQYIVRTIDGNSGQSYPDLRSFIEAVDKHLTNRPPEYDT